MVTKEQWMREAESASNHYLNLNDGGFDEQMKAYFSSCNFEEKSITYGFPTQNWQINERGGIHGGAIAGMFDTAFGITANFIAGKNEAATVDMAISFLRGLEIGDTCEIKVITVKAGRSMIRLRAEMTCNESGKLIASGTGSWMPL
ncbi:MAG: PaaI family thioesterase [Clostridiales bacterium]|nr:PaaI family thioesterase [Clostridiales bacterium]